MNEQGRLPLDLALESVRISVPAKLITLVHEIRDFCIKNPQIDQDQGSERAGPPTAGPGPGGRPGRHCQQSSGSSGIQGVLYVQEVATQIM